MLLHSRLHLLLNSLLLMLNGWFRLSLRLRDRLLLSRLLLLLIQRIQELLLCRVVDLLLRHGSSPLLSLTFTLPLGLGSSLLGLLHPSLLFLHRELLWRWAWSVLIVSVDVTHEAADLALVQLE